MELQSTLIRIEQSSNDLNTVCMIDYIETNPQLYGEFREIWHSVEFPIHFGFIYIDNLESNLVDGVVEENINYRFVPMNSEGSLIIFDHFHCDNTVKKKLEWGMKKRGYFNQIEKIINRGNIPLIIGSVNCEQDEYVLGEVHDTIFPEIKTSRSYKLNVKVEASVLTKIEAHSEEEAKLLATKDQQILESSEIFDIHVNPSLIIVEGCGEQTDIEYIYPETPEEVSKLDQFIGRAYQLHKVKTDGIKCIFWD